MTSGELDAVLLAYAGLARIGRLDAVSQVFEPDEMLPAAGQGALAVECRQDSDLAGLLAAVDDPVSHAAVIAERGVLAALRAGCSAPVGAYAAGTQTLELTAVVAAVDGDAAVRASAAAPAAAAAQLGAEVAAELLRRGAGQYLATPSEYISSGDDAS